MSVSMSTAVWIVMCSEPVMRAPASGLRRAVLGAQGQRPGISCSARWISLRPNGGEGEVGDLEVVAASSGVRQSVVTAPESTGRSSRSHSDPRVD